MLIRPNHLSKLKYSTCCQTLRWLSEMWIYLLVVTDHQLCFNGLWSLFSPLSSCLLGLRGRTDLVASSGRRLLSLWCKHKESCELSVRLGSVHSLCCPADWAHKPTLARSYNKIPLVSTRQYHCASPCLYLHFFCFSIKQIWHRRLQLFYQQSRVDRDGRLLTGQTEKS